MLIGISKQSLYNIHIYIIHTGFLISVGFASGVRAGTQKLGNFCLLLLLLGRSSYCTIEDKSSFDPTGFKQYSIRTYT